MNVSMEELSAAWPYVHPAIMILQQGREKPLLLSSILFYLKDGSTTGGCCENFASLGAEFSLHEGLHVRNDWTSRRQ